MTYSDVEIEQAIDHGLLNVTPLDPENIQPSSIDLRFSGRIAEPADRGMDHIAVDRAETYPSHERHVAWEETCNSEDGYVRIPPNTFVLAETIERVDLSPSLVGRLEGRSSVGRLGLFVENAGLVDAGFTGTLTLELFNASRNAIALKDGMRICQLTIEEHETPSSVGYDEKDDGKYTDQVGPTPSRLYEDFGGEE